MLNHAYENVPYYRKIFDKLGLVPKDIQSFKDLQKLPFLTKNIIQENVDDLKAKNYPECRFEYQTTGGSTGFPLGFYVEKGVWLANHVSFVKMLMNRAGYRFMDKTVSLTGSDIIWKYHPIGRTLVLSSFYMNDENLPMYIKKIIKLKPKYITAYPSAVTILANFINENNIEKIWSIKAIFCHGETIYDLQRELIEETFQCKVYDQYGHREQCVLAGTCEYSNYYHIFPEYGIVELIGNNGKPVIKEGEMGEIVATGFKTYIFPFIRYKTGDMGVYTVKKCECGRNYPLLKKIEGRLQEFIVSKTKQLTPLTGIYHLVAKCSQNVKESQLYQEQEGEIILNIVKRENFTNNDAEKINKGFKKRFGEEFNLTIRYADHIPRTSRGKYRFLIQKLPIEFHSNQ